MTKAKAKESKKQGLPIWLIGLIVLIVIGVAGFLAIQSSNSAAQVAYPAEISVAQAAEKRDQGAFILDVRQPEEWAQVHIPGATLIPLGELPNRLNEVPKDKEVVVVCRSGNRSAQGRDILKNGGYEKVTSMAGGMTKWQAQGLPTTSGQ